MKKTYLTKKGQVSTLPAIVVPIVVFCVMLLLFLALLFVISAEKKIPFFGGSKSDVKMSSISQVSHSMLPSLLRSRVSFISSTGQKSDSYNISLYEIIYYKDYFIQKDIQEKYQSAYLWQLQQLHLGVDLYPQLLVQTAKTSSSKNPYFFVVPKLDPTVMLHPEKYNEELVIHGSLVKLVLVDLFPEDPYMSTLESVFG